MRTLNSRLNSVRGIFDLRRPLKILKKQAFKQLTLENGVKVRNSYRKAEVAYKETTATAIMATFSKANSMEKASLISLKVVKKVENCTKENSKTVNSMEMAQYTCGTAKVTRANGNTASYRAKECMHRRMVIKCASPILKANSHFRTTV